MSDNAIRTFVGVALSAAVSEYLTELQTRLKTLPGRVKWTNLTASHLTLTFLGDTQPDFIEEMSPKIQRICEDFIPFQLALRETGVFPHANHPRVLWVGVEDESVSLSALKKQIDEIMIAAGFDIDRRHFVPHITLGRVKFLKPASELLHSLLSTALPPLIWRVESVNWYRSELKPTGAEYSTLKVFNLNKGGLA
ncbi:MAG: RNA 2',3'-cyclic phosphodiesterase [Lentisphaeria bacterium]|nr:RNA 2',3'-cyclic phosphodiesterase [Candidatus Neomarinimicrobiota bacterium]MCF7841383.1 RNA 2',3'-cyclic phosphodiesterase [Lentisphaeria bacterium]